MKHISECLACCRSKRNLKKKANYRNNESKEANNRERRRTTIRRRRREGTGGPEMPRSFNRLTTKLLINGSVTASLRWGVCTGNTCTREARPLGRIIKRQMKLNVIIIRAIIDHDMHSRRMATTLSFWKRSQSKSDQFLSFSICF